MKCEFDYCIYNHQLTCILESTYINAAGECAECMLVTLEEAFLESEKQRQLKAINERMRQI